MSEPALDAIGNVLKAEAKNIEFDLDNWITDFEACFPNFEKMNPILKQGFWGKPFTSRPRIKELNEQENARVDEGYRVVEFFPDRDNKEESYILFGLPTDLMTQIVLMMNLRRTFETKDIGSFLGYPIDDYYQQKPKQGLSVRVFLTTSKNPAYYGSEPDKWFSRCQVYIPFVDKRKLTYKNLRNACNGSAGLNWGEWQARATLDKSGSSNRFIKMLASGSTEQQAKQNLERFLKLSTANIAVLNYGKMDFSKGERAKDPDKDKYNSFDVYPAWVTVLNSKITPNALKSKLGRQTLLGRQWGKHVKLPLYTEKEPQGWSDAMREVLRVTGDADD